MVTEFLPDVARHVNFNVVFIQRIINRVAIEDTIGPANGGALAAIRGLTASQLFKGQTRPFFDFVTGLAVALIVTSSPARPAGAGAGPAFAPASTAAAVLRRISTEDPNQRKATATM